MKQIHGVDQYPNSHFTKFQGPVMKIATAAVAQNTPLLCNRRSAKIPIFKNQLKIG
jgi:hypothetical protein